MKINSLTSRLAKSVALAALLASQPAQATLTWDANGATAGQTDGAGAWLGANLWWNGATNQTWASGSDAVFGVGGTGGAVTLASPTTVNSLTFNSFTGTYTLGTSAQAITLNGNITINSAAAAVTIVSPVTMAASENWTNSSAAGKFTVSGAVTGGANILTLDGTGAGLTTLTGGLSFSGAGGLIIGKTGTLGTTISGGTITLGGTGGLTINNGSSAVSLGAASITADQSWANNSSTAMTTGVLTLTNQLTLTAGTFTLGNNANTGTGGVVINGATVTNLNAAAFGTGTLTLTSGKLSGGSTFARTWANALVINGSFTLGDATYNGGETFTGATQSLTGSNTITLVGGNVSFTTGAMSLAAGSNTTFSSAGPTLTMSGGFNTNGGIDTLTFNTAANAVTLSGPMSATGTLVLAGSGTNVTLGALTLSANALQINSTTGGVYTSSGASTFTGGVTLTSGVLNINAVGVAGTSGPLGNGGVFTIAGGTIDNTSGAAKALLNNNPITVNGDFAFTGGAGTTHDLNLGTGTVDLGAGTRTITANAGILTLGGNVSNGGITKAGNGTVVLSGNNAYAGTTTVSAGTLNFYNLTSLYGGTTTSWTSTNIDVKSGATLAVGYGNAGQFSSGNIDTLRSQLSAASGGFEAGARLGIDTTGVAASSTYASTITDTAAGALSVTKLGANTLSLTGASTYTGVTTVVGGQLSAVLTDGGLPSPIGASSNAASNLVLINGAVLPTNFTTDRLFSLGGNSTVTIGNDGGTQTWYNYGAIGFIDSNSSNTIVFGNGYEPGHLYFSPQIVDNGTGKTNVNTGGGKSNSAGALNQGLVLINTDNSYTGITTVNGNVSVYKMDNGGVNSSMGASSSAASNLVFGGSWDYFVYLGSGDSTDRNYTMTSSSLLSWDSSGTGALLMSGNATYTGTANTVRRIAFTGTNADANSYGGILADNGTGLLAVTKKGIGSWTLANAANTYTGVTTISGGILSVGTLANGGIPSSIGASSNAAANLVLAGGTLQYTGAAQNTDRLFTIAPGGGGTIDASGASNAALSFTNAGIQSPDVASRSGTTATNVLTVGSTADLFVGMAVSGTGIAAGTTITAITAATTATLSTTPGTQASNTIAFGYGARTLTLTGASAGTIAGILQDSATVGGTLGTLGVTKTGAGTWTLPGTNTYTGVTTISGGILSAGALADGGSNSSIGASTSAGANLRFSGGTLQYTGAAQNTDRLFTIAPGGATIDASGASNAALSFTNSGIYSPETASRLGSTATNVLTVGSTADLFVGMAVNGTGIAAGTTITAINTATTATLSTTPGIHASNTITFGYGARTLTLTGASTGTIAGILQDSATVGGTAGTLGVTKTGTGTWTLAGTNTYTGTTTISSGILLINGSTASGSAVSLGAATLGGSGTVYGTVTTAGTTSVISPGNSPGTLTLGALNAASGADFVFQLGGTSSDVLTNTGLFTGSTAAGGLKFDFSDSGGLIAGSPYTIINFGSSSGLDYTDFSVNSLPGSFTMDTAFGGGGNGFKINGSNLQVQFAVPEPQTWALLAAGLTVVVTFRRRR